MNATVTVETMLVDVNAQPVEVRVEHAPVRTVKVATVGPQGPVGPVADLNLVLAAVDQAVADYRVLHPDSFDYVQGAEVYQVDIVHPLDHYPAVTAVDSAGDVVRGAVSYPAPNRVTVDFNVPFAGRFTLT